MSEKVELNGSGRFFRARQWATGFFYRREGRKLTVISRNLAIFSTVLLLGFGSWIVIFGPSSESDSSLSKSSISAPVTLVQSESGELVQITNGSQDQSLGQRKRGWSKYSGPQVVKRSVNIKIPPGTMLQAFLVSGASDGPIRAEVRESFNLLGENLIEEGAVLIGTGQSTNTRLLVRFTQMITKDGAVTPVQAQACDFEDKIVGLKGSQVGNQVFKLAAGIGLNFVGGMSQALQQSDIQYGFGVRSPSPRNVMLNGASTAALEYSQELMNEYKNKQPKIEKEQGVPIFILFEGNG